MPRRVIFRPLAESDAIETRAWYEARRAGLGDEFTAALEHVIERISARPSAYARVRGETRRAVLERFPYSVYFRLVGPDIVVLAVHGRQHPSRWQARR